MNIDPTKINELTEVETGYKLFNLNLVDLYNGLHPAQLSKLAHVLFSCLMYNKMHKKPDAKGYSEDEAKRIFTSISAQPTDLAKRIHPVKYADGSNAVDTDISNILKRLDELDALNVFYIWRFKQPYTFMFVMERDVSSWKYYNPNGCLYPKSLRKVLRLAKSMIDTMENLEGYRGRDVIRLEIEKSFGEFINRLIEKMHKAVASSLPKWDETKNIFSYASDLMSELKKLDDHAGCEYDELFTSRLPEPIKNRVLKLNKGANMNAEQLTAELVPANGNIVKHKIEKDTLKTKRKTSIPEDGAIFMPEQFEFKELTPFKNPTQLTKFYRAFLKMYNNETTFYSFASEVIWAAELLDKMMSNGKNENLDYLKAWIRFYLLNYLKGNAVLNCDKTSIKEFGKTFDAYNKVYIG